MILSKSNNAALLNRIVTEKIDLNVTDNDGKHAFHFAASNGHVEALRLLLKICPNHINALKKSDWTPLMMAASKSAFLPVIEILVENGADLTVQNKDGWNALHIAGKKQMIFEKFRIMINLRINDEKFRIMI